MNHPADFLDQHAPAWERLTQHIQATPLSPSLLLVGLPDHKWVEPLIEELLPHSSHRQHVLLDLGRTQVTSLLGTLQDRLADIISQPAHETSQYVVHIVRLEHTLLREILDGNEPLISTLQAEAADLQSGLGLTLVVWVDSYACRRLFQEAPDFWDRLSEVITFFALEEDEDAPADPAYAHMRELTTRRAEAETPQAALHYEIGQVLEQQGLLDQARIYYQQALAQTDEASLQLNLYEGLAHIAEAEHEPAVAIDAYNSALELAEDNSLEAARLYQQQGELFLRGQASEEAMTAFRYALEAYRSHEDEQGQAQSLRRLAHMEERKGNLDQSVAYYSQAIELLEREGGPEPLALAGAYQQVGAIRQNQQRYAEALSSFEHALPYARETGDEFLVAALEDSIETMTEEVKRRGSKSSGEKKRRGLFGRMGRKG